MRRETLIGGIAVIALIGILAFFFMQRDEKKKYPQGGSQIIAFGDSLVEGVGASPGHDFVSILSDRLRSPIINAGRAGDTTAAGLLRLNEAVLAQDPKIVIVLLGGNDALRRIPKEETFRNLETIIDRIQGRGAAVILIGVRGGILSDSYKKSFSSIAAEKGAFYIPDILDDIFGNARLISDPIHPNDQGYALMADRIEPVLKMVMAK
ncbi:MAG: arylesterase [Candidatus Sungbacteria bacterium]|uniref:Arylesterase n=1 Tax=Candidatus Sungiibacteriota bacterium TaxID=2750080 RepID=A0A931SD23_9BACT|nr:arylesterase [Candidatus Sungbacteria bacterium]